MEIDLSLKIAFGILVFLAIVYFIFGPKIAQQIAHGEKKTPTQKFFKYLPIFAAICVLAVVFGINMYYSKGAAKTEIIYNNAQDSLNKIMETPDTSNVKDSAELQQQRKNNYNEIAKALVKLKKVESNTKKEEFITGKSTVDTNLVQSQVKKATEELQKLSLFTPRVYIQIANSSQIKQVTLLTHLLDSAGFVVPEYENMEGTKNITSKTQVRFYHDDEWTEASKIIDIIRANMPGLSIIEKPIKRSSDKVRPRHYELWLANN